MTTKQRWLLVLTALAAFMTALDLTIVTTALSTIKVKLGASVEDLEWTVNAYVLCFAVLLLTVSALGDRLGRRKVFAAGLIVFTASSVACALAPSIGALIAARAVQGVGAAAVLPLSMTQVAAGFSPAERGKALGRFAGIIGLATLGGPFVGGAVAQGLSWRWLFWINVPIGIAVIAGTLLNIDETFGPRRPFDVGGVLFAVGGSLGLVWGLVRGNQAGWLSAETLGTLIAGAVLTVAFVLWERRVPAPMLPVRFFGDRAFAGANAANFLVIGSMYGTLFFLAQYYQNVLGYSAFSAGAHLVPWTATLIVTAPPVGALADRLGPRRFVVGGLVLQTAALAWMALTAKPGMSYATLLPALVVGGCGISMTMPTTQKATVGAVRPEEIGQATGAYSMLRQFGGLFGTAIAVAVFSAAGSYATPASFADGFKAAMAVLAGFAAVGAAAGLLLPGKPARAVAATASAVAAPASGSAAPASGSGSALTPQLAPDSGSSASGPAAPAAGSAAPAAGSASGSDRPVPAVFDRA